LDRLTRHRGDDVAWPLRVSVRHVFDETDGTDRVHSGLAAGERMHQADDASRARHVAFHVLHTAGGLDRDTAGVEANALADESNRRRTAFAAVPAHDRNPAGVSRALPYAEQGVHAELLHRA